MKDSVLVECYKRMSSFESCMKCFGSCVESFEK